MGGDDVKSDTRSAGSQTTRALATDAGVQTIASGAPVSRNSQDTQTECERKVERCTVSTQTDDVTPAADVRVDVETDDVPNGEQRLNGVDSSGSASDVTRVASGADGLHILSTLALHQFSSATASRYRSHTMTSASHLSLPLSIDTTHTSSGACSRSPPTGSSRHLALTSPEEDRSSPLGYNAPDASSIDYVSLTTRRRSRAHSVPSNVESLLTAAAWTSRRDGDHDVSSLLNIATSGL